MPMYPKVCWDAKLGRHVPCPDAATPTAVVGGGKESDDCCLDGCPITCPQMSAIVLNSQNYLTGQTGQNEWGFELSMLFDPNPLLSTVGNELYYDGVATGWNIATVTNPTLAATTTGSYTWAVGFATAGTCPDFAIVFTLDIDFTGIDFIITKASVNWCIKSGFGAVTAATRCSPCGPGEGRKCSQDVPSRGLAAPTTLQPLDPGMTLVTFANPILTGGNACCRVLGLATSIDLLQAEYLDNNTIRFTNYSSATIDTDFTVVVYTSCGVVGEALSFNFSTCTGTITATPHSYHIGNFIDPGTLTGPVRKTGLYTLDDPTGCCEPITIASGDPNVSIADVGTNWEFTISPSTFGNGAHQFPIVISSNCGTVNKIMTFNKQIEACTTTGVMTPLETDLNTATGVATFNVPQGGSLTITLLTDLFSLNDACCGTTVVLTNSLPISDPLTQVSVQPTTDGLALSEIVLTAIAGEVPNGVKNEKISVIGNCGAFVLDIQYQIV